MSGNSLEKLFEHNNWANMQILQACAGLTDDQLDAPPVTATLGTIRQTLFHLISSQRGYLSLLTLPVEERHNEPLEFSELQEVARDTGDKLLALVKADGIPTARLQTRDGFHVEPWVVVVQIINHATEHREQVKSMLTALGMVPPEIDGWSYGEATHTLIPIS